MAKINAYRTPPQAEQKAAAELREAGIRAYVPTEIKTRRTAKGARRVRVPAAPGYVFAPAKPYDSKHVREHIGACDRLEVRRLYQRDGKPDAAYGYQPGERIEITRGHATTIPATVIERCGDRGHWYMVEIGMMGKACRVKMRLEPRPQIR